MRMMSVTRRYMLQWLCSTVLTKSLDKKKGRGKMLLCNVIGSFIVDFGPQGSGKVKLGINPNRRRLLSMLTSSRQLPSRESRAHKNVRCGNAGLAARAS